MEFEPIHLRAIAENEVCSILNNLPLPLRLRAKKLPVSYELKPSRDLQADGIEGDTLGLFIGPAFAEEEYCSSPLPPHIILFLENLWDCAESNESVYRKEVRDTFLHELGHYLGLDESDLLERGL